MSAFVVFSLLAGIALSVPYLAWAGRGRRRHARGLGVAALLYVLFAVWAAHPLPWLLLELGGVLLYGTVAWLGVRFNPWWLVAGWLLHPLWDMVLHGHGQGAALAPPGYAVACLSFDMLVACVLAVRLWRRPPASVPVKGCS